jgi:hypothetical protein
MPLLWKNGGLVWYNGGLAIDEDLCDCECGGVEECLIPPDLPESLSLTVTSSNANLSVSDQMDWLEDLLADEKGWKWEDERCCLDSGNTSWCGYTVRLFCNTIDHPLYNSNYPVDAYLVTFSSSMFDPAANGGSVLFYSQPTSVSFSPFTVTGSIDTTSFDGDCGGAATSNYTITE